MIKIGNKNHISFEFIGKNSPKELLDLNFYLGNKLISNEPTFLPSYILSLQTLIENVTKKQFENFKFEKMSSEQTFKTLLKERNSDETQFFKHLVQLDETIDPYTIFIFQMNKVIKFVWTCWDENNCNSGHKLNMICSVQFPIEELIITVKELLKKIR